MKKLVLLHIILSGTLLFSCKKRIPLTVEKINDNQVAPLNSVMPLPYQIKALNHKNEPIEGLKVRFFIKNGNGIFDGNVYEVFDTTDSEGIAECFYRLGTDTFAQQIEVDLKKYEGETVIFNASPEYLTDSRDGQQYLLTQIGNQIWTAENIRFNKAGSRQNPNSVVGYGRLYNWYDAQTVCPSGFRLPSIAEFQTMTADVGNEYFSIGRKLKSKSDWLHNEEGRNLVGFDLYPAGNYLSATSNYNGLGEYSVLWSSDEENNLDGRYAILSYNSQNMYYAFYAKSTTSSCRCIKE